MVIDLLSFFRHARPVVLYPRPVIVEAIGISCSGNIYKNLNLQLSVHLVLGHLDRSILPGQPPLQCRHFESSHNQRWKRAQNCYPSRSGPFNQGAFHGVALPSCQLNLTAGAERRMPYQVR